MRKFKVSLFGLAAAFSLAALSGCGKKVPTIWVGNTAATSGAFAGVGVPFNAALEARLHTYNAAGGFRDHHIKLKHYDDQFTATEGLTLTKRLVEDDKVFALVGHFGTPTVGATLEYIKEVGVPMVYAATGINDLYTEAEVGNPIFAVQPIYRTEGRVMVARAYGNKNVFGPITGFDENNLPIRRDVDKIGVFYTEEDAGRSLLAGIEAQMAALGKTAKLVKFSGEPGAQDYLTQATAIKDAGIDVLLGAANQAPFRTLMNALAEQDVSVPVITSYVNANNTEIELKNISATRPVYANAWVDVYSDSFGPAYATYLETMTAALEAKAITQAEHDNAIGAGFAYGLAGYIAAETFLAGLKAMTAEEEFTAANYISALEKAPLELPFTNGVDFTGGKRWGIEQLVLSQRVFFPAGSIPGVEEDYDGFIKVADAEPLQTILDRIPA